MGVYSQFDRYVTESANDETYADESYFGIVGAYQAMEESSINAHSIFEAIIGRDFAEAEMQFENSAISESDMEMINEAVGGGIWAKVKEFVQKVWNKLLGILKSIKDRIVAVFTRDGKELVNKFSKQIKTKLRTGKLSKFKWKFFEKGSYKSEDMTKENIMSKFTVGMTKSKVLISAYDNCAQAAQEAKKFATANAANKKSSDSEVQDSNKNEDDSGNRTAHAPYTSDQKNDFLENLLGSFIDTNDCTKSDFSKEFEEKYLGDLEEKEDIDGTTISSFEDVLTKGKKILKSIDDAEKGINKEFKEIKKNVDMVDKQASKATVDYHNANLASRFAARTNTCISILQTGCSTYFSAYIGCVKKYLAQTRKVYISAATFNQKGDAYEEATLMEAVGDVSDYEVEEMFAAY